MKILLAVDGSAYTSKAVKYVISHMNWFEGNPELHLLHVNAPVPKGLARSIAGKAAVENYYREESAAALAPAEKLLNKSEIPFQASYQVGSVSEEIQAYAKKNGIDMIVMGYHGHGVLKNLIMGSVATKVLATTSVPVLIVH